MEDQGPASPGRRVSVSSIPRSRRGSNASIPPPRKEHRAPSRSRTSGEGLIKAPPARARTSVDPAHARDKSAAPHASRPDSAEARRFQDKRKSHTHHFEAMEKRRSHAHFEGMDKRKSSMHHEEKRKTHFQHEADQVWDKKRSTTHGSVAVTLAIEAIAEAKAIRKSAIDEFRASRAAGDTFSESDFSDDYQTGYARGGPMKDEPANIPHWKRAGAETYNTTSTSRKLEQMEARTELREFLKVVRPEWSLYDKRAVASIERVMEKLEAIGVTDITGLMQRVNTNSINMDLSQMGRSRFEDETLQKLRTAKSFLRALEHLKEPFYRQIGNFAQVRQLLSKNNLWNWDDPKAVRNSDGSPAKGSKVEDASSASKVASKPAETSSSSPSKPPRRSSATSAGGKTPKGGSSPLKDGLKEKSGGLSYSDTDLDLMRMRTRTKSKDSATWGKGIRSHKGYAKAAQHANKVHRKSISQLDIPEEILALSALDHPKMRFLTRPSSSSDPGRKAAYSEFAEMARPQRPHSAAAAPSMHRTPSRSALVNARENASSSPRQSNDASSEFLLDSPPQRVKPLAMARTKTMPETALGRQKTMAVATADDGTVETPNTPALEQEVERIQQAGSAMSEKHRKPCWSNLRQDNLHEQASAMLEEQMALDERIALFKLMEREGLASPTRQAIAGNIKCRLQDLAPRDAKQSSDVHMRATNIRNHLQQLLQAKRELRSVRKSTQVLLKEDDRTRVIESFKRNALIAPGALAGIAAPPR